MHILEQLYVIILISISLSLTGQNIDELGGESWSILSGKVKPKGISTETFFKF